jgi:PleD family two-component response regulator
MALKPCILIAGTRHAIDVLAAVLGPDFEVTGATSLGEALRRVSSADLVICNVQFDDSRMFEFLHELEGRAGGRKVPIICCRIHQDPLSANVRRAIEHALEALGIAIFVDRPLLLERYPVAVVDEMLRQLVIDRLPARLGGR